MANNLRELFNLMTVLNILTLPPVFISCVPGRSCLLSHDVPVCDLFLLLNVWSSDVLWDFTVPLPRGVRWLINLISPDDPQTHNIGIHRKVHNMLMFNDQIL